MPEITVHELKKKQDANDDIILIDVREKDEYDTCNLNGMLIPLGELPARLPDLDPNAHYVVHCKMGGRSAQAVAHMQSAGFTNVKNLVGGIITWIDEIDSSLRKY
ncbi:MAG: rhodanese-like domain-containing protein [Candidatus Margulisbacteria bacterium]|nr:rhodanese-like domain-containing protein [Candidatus Margulisiibacteriota bacterium]